MTSEMLQVDELKLYFGEGCAINDKMIVRQPRIGEIVDMGEAKYFTMLHSLTATPSDMIAQLDKMKMDWEGIEDFELFSMLALSIPHEDSQILFGDIDLSDFQIVPIEGEGVHRHVLRHTKLGFDFDELDYQKLMNYLCKLHNIPPAIKRKKVAGNATTKKMMIEMAHEDLEIEKRKRAREGIKSQFRPLISTLVNSPGFKYNLQQVRDIGIYEFFDSVNRIQVITSSQALLQGCYMGNIDMKKLDKKELNYMRDIS